MDSHIHATRGDVAHVDAKVVEHESQEGAVAGRVLWLGGVTTRIERSVCDGHMSALQASK